MKNLYIVGAGGFGRELLNLILDIHAIVGPRWNIVGFLDDTDSPLEGKACDCSVVGTITDYSPHPDDVLAFGIADPVAKQKLIPMLKARGATFEQIIHPYTYLGRNNTFGEGVIIDRGACMSVNVALGDFATLRACSLGHDVQVGEFCTISAMCNIMGRVSLGRGVFIGGNVAIAPCVTVGNNAYLCMGSMVMKDVLPEAKIMGNPAREIG